MRKNWALIENGEIHTKRLTKADAEEMLERHEFFFPNLDYSIGLTKDYS